MKPARVLQLLCLVIIVVVSFLITVPVGEAFSSSAYDMCVISVFAVNGVIVLALLVDEVRKRPYSMAMIHWVFCLFFFVFAPASQYITRKFPWGIQLSDELVLLGGVYCLIWIVSFAAGLHCETLQKNLAKIGRITLVGGGKLRKRQALFSLINVIITIYQLVMYGFSGSLVRGSSIVKTDVSSLGLLFGHCLTAFMSLTSAGSAILMRRDKGCRKFFTVNLVCMLLTYFPTVMARNGMAGAYGGIFIAMFPKLKKNRKFIFVIITAVLVVFPMFGAFRNVAFSDSDIASVFERTIRGMPAMWLSNDFDAFTTLLISMQYTAKYGITWGWQLLGAVLFWYPRVLWPSFLPPKPVGSGYFSGQKMGMSFLNISCPLPGEGNINFGIAGVVLFGLSFGAIAGSLDRSYWRSPDDETFSVIYPTLMFMFFFMSRGDLMSSLAFTVAFAAVWRFLAL